MFYMFSAMPKSPALAPSPLRAAPDSVPPPAPGSAPASAPDLAWSRPRPLHRALARQIVPRAGTAGRVVGRTAGRPERQWSSRMPRCAVGPAGQGPPEPSTASLDIRPRRPNRGRAPASVDPARTPAVPVVAQVTARYPLVGQVAARYPLVDMAVVQPSTEKVIAAVRARRTADPPTTWSSASACSDLATSRGAAARERLAYRLTAAGRRQSAARGRDPRMQQGSGKPQGQKSPRSRPEAAETPSR
jgi:hypothetical protein